MKRATETSSLLRANKRNNTSHYRTLHLSQRERERETDRNTHTYADQTLNVFFPAEQPHDEAPRVKPVVHGIKKLQTSSYNFHFLRHSLEFPEA